MQNITISNIYWMLAYAFETLNEGSKTKINSEEFENIYDMFCVMITQELNKQIKRGLNCEYVTKEDELSLLHGKILINKSINNQYYLTNRLTCEYDDYTTNSYLNKIVKTACTYLIKSNKIKDKEKIKKLKSTMLYLHEIDILDRKTINWSKVKYNTNNKSYKILINISYLILDGLILNNKDGKEEFREFIDDQKMHKLYEKFILNYYIYHHNELDPKVSKIDWNVEKNESLIFLPEMKTDITLTHNEKKLIIDAKYYSKEFQNNPLYDKETFRSNNLYQIYTYVKNEDKMHSGNVSGMLLYAKTNESEEIEKTYNMDGNDISVLNLDLSKDFDTIKNKLEEIVIKYLKD